MVNIGGGGDDGEELQGEISLFFFAKRNRAALALFRIYLMDLVPRISRFENPFTI